MPNNRKFYLEIDTKNISVGLARFSYLVDPIKINKIIKDNIEVIRKKYNLPKSRIIGLSEYKHDGKEQDDSIRFSISGGIRTNVDRDAFNNCSHIVSCEIAEKGQKVNNENYSLRLVTNDIKLIVDFIIDVMLDIQMFYILDWNYEFDILDKRKEFSKLKVEFCKTNGMSSVLDNCVNYDNYCSFASFCRLGSSNDYDLDIKKYLQIWQDFSNYLIAKLEWRNKEALVDDIIRCDKSGSIKVSVLHNIIRNLPNGRYSFIRIISKIPSNHYAQIDPLFKGRLKIGHMVIVERIKEYKYIQFVNEKLLYIYKFTIKE